MVLGVFLSACGNGGDTSDANRPPAQPDAYISTDSGVYTAVVSGQTANFQLAATYTNRGDTPVYVVVCGEDLPFHKWQKYIDGRWQNIEAIVGYSCASELNPLEITSQETLTKQFIVSFDLPYELKGFYRLVWESVTGESNVEATPIAEEQRVSNFFEIQ